VSLDAESNRAPVSTPARSGPASRWWWMIGLVVLGVAVWFIFSRYLSLNDLAHQEARLRELGQQYPFVSALLAAGLYTTVTGLSLPGAAALTLLYGWYFGTVIGTILVSFCSTAGATIAFLFSRLLFRDIVESRFGSQVDSFRESVRREGPFFLFTLRLIPAVPFFIVNLVMGVTSIPAKTFWWVSQLGMLPGTIVYTYAGASVPSLRLLADEGIRAVFTATQLTRIVMALAALGLFPIVIRFLFRMGSRRRSATNRVSSRAPIVSVTPQEDKPEDAGNDRGSR
jgi:uncharacterized membrane protein YdjX (TVP38/TMEM64 family)